jgi:hypothetical protein
LIDSITCAVAGVVTPERRSRRPGLATLPGIPVLKRQRNG